MRGLGPLGLRARAAAARAAWLGPLWGPCGRGGRAWAPLGPRDSLMVFPKRRGVLIRISCAMQSQLFFWSSCACMRAKAPGFSILKNERAVARMKS